ncbi:MAG: c-type cytochrome [Vicinamibacterales bacterium]
MKPRVNLVLGILLAGSAAAHWALGVDPTIPNVEFLPNMVRSLAAEAFAASDVLPGGQTLQTPPAGTIARGMAPLHYAATPEDAARAGAELSNPFHAEDPGALARGAAVFGNFCVVCHGPGGLGNGPITLRGFPPPVSLLADNALKIRDGQMFHILTFGQKNMPSYAAQITREDRWKAILYVRSLQQQAQAKPPAATPSTPAPTPASGGPRS